jgi:hypothetical protein
MPNRMIAAGVAAASLAAVAVLPAAAAEPDHAEAGAAVVIEWNQTLLGIVRTPGAQPATRHATRDFAIMHAAIYDAVVSVTHSGRPYLFEVVADRHASPVAAAAQAAHDTLVSLYPNQKADLDRKLDVDLAGVRDAAARAGGVRAGALTARLMMGARSNDGSQATPPAIPPGTAPGAYRPTPPAFAAAVFTHWPAVTPFVLDRADQFRPAAYPDLNSAAYKVATDEVRRLGQDTSTMRTEDQTTQAKFWAAPIQNYWNEIAQTTAQAHHVDLVRGARLFAELNLAFADSVIAFYDGKYHYLVWRPVTAIRSAVTDPDPTWTPLATTPNDPAYPGAHSVVSQAAAVVLGSFFGRHEHFSVKSESLPGVQRTFDSFQAAADEAGLSRIYAGVHTRLDHTSGQHLGLEVGLFTLGHAI